MEKLFSFKKGIFLLLSLIMVLSPAYSFGAKHWDNGNLEVSANGHYLQHENGTPFLWAADTAWALIMRLDTTDAETYFGDRSDRGYTVIQTTMCGLGQGILDASWQLGCGVKPFTDDNPKTPNEAYWQHVDDIIELAENHNLYIALVVPWKELALGPPYSHREDKIFTVENTDDFATFIANRYKNSPNIIWIIGGDAPGHAQDDTFEMMNLFGTTIKGIDNNHLITYHGSAEGKPSSSYFFHDETWLDFNMTYPGWGEHYAAYLEDYNLVPAKPAVNGESVYAGCRGGDPEQLQCLVRRQFYWNILTGGAGYTHGQQDMWNMWRDDEPNHVYLRTWGEDNWWGMLGDQDGTLEFMYWKDFFTAIDWWKLIPDNSGIIASGEGSGEWIKAAARSSDGNLVLVYYPERASATINLTKITSEDSVSAKWWDPRDKSETEIGNYTASGVRIFTPPPEWEDALLVLEALPSVSPPGDPSVVHGAYLTGYAR